jgi:hypothetical protein
MPWFLLSVLSISDYPLCRINMGGENGVYLNHKIANMTEVTIRKKLMDYMQVADNKKLKAIYTLLEEEIEQEGKMSMAQYNKELEAAEAEFKSGDFITHVAMKKKIKQWKTGGAR